MWNDGEIGDDVKNFLYREDIFLYIVITIDQNTAISGRLHGEE